MEFPEPKGFVPYVYCRDAGLVADWCVRVLGFVERQRWSTEGVVHNVELMADGHEVWLDGGHPGAPDRARDLPSWVGLWVDDVDAVHERLLRAGEEVAPPVDRDFGVRMVTAADPEGHQWGFLHRAR